MGRFTSPGLSDGALVEPYFCLLRVIWKQQLKELNYYVYQLLALVGQIPDNSTSSVGNDGAEWQMSPMKHPQQPGVKKDGSICGGGGILIYVRNRAQSQQLTGRVCDWIFGCAPKNSSVSAPVRRKTQSTVRLTYFRLYLRTQTRKTVYV